jgi:hypothetical protein
VGLGSENTLAVPPNDSLINRQVWRGGTVLRQLDAVHHKGVRLALGTFVFCRTEDVMCEAGLAKLDEIRKLNSTQSAIRILTNTDHPITPYFTNPNKVDEYALCPRNPQQRST